MFGQNSHTSHTYYPSPLPHTILIQHQHLSSPIHHITYILSFTPATHQTHPTPTSILSQPPHHIHTIPQPCDTPNSSNTNIYPLSTTASHTYYPSALRHTKLIQHQHLSSPIHHITYILSLTPATHQTHPTPTSLLSQPPHHIHTIPHPCHTPNSSNTNISPLPSTT